MMNVSTAETAVDHLGIREAIEDKIDLIYDRLDAERGSVTAESDARVLVVTAFLPTMSIFINYASDRDHMTAAIRWLRETMGIEQRDEAMSLLSTLTLMIMVRTGLRVHAADPVKVAGWMAIDRYIQESLEEVDAPAAY
jgi:hypothetical protein